MRLNMTQQGGLADEFVSGGGSVLNPLILAGNPSTPLEAATKQYVDNSLLSLNVNNIISGTIPGNRFPAMNGDLVSSSGSSELILSNTGVTAGTYPKVSVDNKGRVTNGLPLIESDIPVFSWNKVTTDKPNTLAGYGVNDALSVSGGTMTGQLSITGTPTLANQLVNKSYLDGVVGGSTGIAIGDIIAKLDTSTPSGFLKCNGAELDKIAYADLYNVIGDTYVINGKSGNGQPWKNQYEINTDNLGDLSNWKAIAPLPGVLGGSSTFVTKNRIYTFGGFNGSGHVGTGYTALINEDGTLGAWTATTALPGVYAYSACVVTKNKVYLLGGYINNTTATNIIYMADINADGTIGTWSNGPNLPGVTAYNSAFINKNKLYVVGGYNGSTGLTSVFSTNIKEDGSLGVWGTETPMPVSVYSTAISVVKNRVYILGGFHNNVYSANIYSAALNADGSIGSWQLTGSLPVTVGYHVSAVTRNVIYVIGGVQANVHSANIYKATILEDGSIGSWQLQSWTLPATVAYSNITITKNHIHMVAGMVASSWSAACYSADMSGGLNDYSSFYSNVIEQNYMVAGSGKPWQQQYQINNTQSSDITDWVTDSSVLPENLVYMQSVVTKNKVYILGGWNGTIPVNSVYSSDINADGTLGTWVTEANLPISLLNFQAVVISDKLYIIGGSNNTSHYSTVYVSTINSDGTLGAWTATNSLPGNLSATQAIVTRNRIYLLGGYNGTAYVSTVYTASVYPDGSLGTWTSGTSLPISLTNSQAVVTKNRVYLIGGYTASTTTLSTIYTAPINSDGALGAWSNSGLTLPASLGETQVFITKTTLYVLGGSTGGATSVSTVYKSAINTDGILSAFSAVTSLPSVLSQSCIAVTNNRLYLLGGKTVAITNVIYSAPILEGLNDYSAYYVEDNNNYLYPGSGKPWQHQYQVNTSQSTDITGWTTGIVLPVNINASQAIVTKNRVYLLGGGQGNGTASATVYTAPINSDGTLGAWVTDTSLPGALFWSQAIATKNRVYLIGGSGSSAVYTAPINADGTLGTWSTGNALPINLGQSQTFISKNRLYLLAGTTTGSNAVTTVYTATINSDGTLGGWNSSNTVLPGALANHQLIVTKNRIYVCGGYSGASYSSAVYTAVLNPDGTLGDWSTSASLPGIKAFGCSITTKDRAYIFGGYTGAAYVSTVYTAPINSDGTLGAWDAGTSLPGSTAQSTAIVTKNHIHLLGGFNGAYLATVYTATIDGGLNDYSSYFNGDILPVEQFVTEAKFKLPDASFSNDNLNYFIKF